MSVSLIGCQRPTLLHEPPGAVDWSLSEIAVDFARECGYVLDEWQEWLVRWTFARRADRLWAARDVVAEVPRQNGKNVWLEVVELVSVFLFRDRLLIHSAHRADVSQEHFLAMKERIEGCPDLFDVMPSTPNRGFMSANGKESITLANGARILFKARAKASGRGPRPQKIVFDEALVLDDGQVGSMAPGTSAQANPQIIMASSAPKADSVVLHRQRRRALLPEAGDRLFYAGWNNPVGVDVLGDRDAWYRVNPSLGLGRMTEESLHANRKLMDEAEFIREHLGVPEEPVGSGWIVPEDVWRALVDLGSRIVSHRALALDASPDLRSASLAAAGRDDNGRLFVEVFDRRPMTGWVVDRAVEVWQKSGVPLRVARQGPAGLFIGPLRERGVEVVEVSSLEYGQACGQFLDAALNDGLRHWGDSWLDAALAGAALRESGDTRVWSRKTSRVDISPLVAVTVAVGGVPAIAAPSHQLFVAVT